MNQPAKAAKARASMRGKSGEVFCVIARLVPDIFFARMAQIEKLQGAFKKLVDFFFADFLGGQEGVEVEVGKTASGDAGGKKLAQAAGIDPGPPAKLPQEDAAQRIPKKSRVKQPAEFPARSPPNQDPTQEAEGISFQ